MKYLQALSNFMKVIYKKLVLPLKQQNNTTICYFVPNIHNTKHKNQSEPPVASTTVNN